MAKRASARRQTRRRVASVWDRVERDVAGSPTCKTVAFLGSSRAAAPMMRRLERARISQRLRRIHMATATRKTASKKATTARKAPAAKTSRAKTATPKAQDATALLRADHQAVSALFEQYEKARAPT